MAPHAISADTVRDLPLNLPAKTDKENVSVSTLEIQSQDQTQYVLRVFRCLIADLCEQFKGGHPGSAMGMAAIGIALWKYVMRYSPASPNWFNRDRFVLSNGRWQNSQKQLTNGAVLISKNRPYVLVAIHISASSWL